MRRHRVVVFDLEDTLYREIDFLKSGYRCVAQLLNNVKPSITCEDFYDALWSVYQQGGNPFEETIKNYRFMADAKVWMLDVYRNHIPSISLKEGVVEVLEELKNQGVTMGVITDGRQSTQMNKIKTLGLMNYIDEDDIVINVCPERMKPDTRSFQFYEKKYGMGCSFAYVGDNPKKDFFAPNCLGWKTICLLDDGSNIHHQDFTLDEKFMPTYKIYHLKEILNYV